MFLRLGSDSIFGFRKSDLSEAEAQCLGLCGQPWEKKGDSQLELENWAGFLAGEIGSELEERDREPTGRFAIPASLSYRVSDFC